MKTVLFFLFLAQIAWAKSTCTIHIANEKFSGEKIKITFLTKLNSKQECLQLAKLHQTNFQAQEVKSKRVSFYWKGETRRPEVSLSTRRPSRRYR